MDRAARRRFWKDVEALLIAGHHQDTRDARAGVRWYRDEVEDKAGETVYNQGEETTAAIIDQWIEKKPWGD